MPYRFRYAGLVLGMFLLAALASPAHAKLNTFQSRFYKVHTTLSAQKAKSLANYMDIVFAHYRQRFKNFEPRNNRSQPLYLFKHRKQFVQFMGKHGVQAANSGGMFFIKRRIRGLATFTQGRPTERLRTVLQHEGFHQFAWNYIGPNLPQWVNEGLAQYFEDAKIEGKHITLGEADPQRVRVLKRAVKNNNLMSLQRIINISNKEWNQILHKDAAKGRRMYAQAWSMVYFLIHGDRQRYQNAFRQYLHLLADGKSNKQAVKKAFGAESFNAMRRRWVAYMKRHLFN